MVPTFMEDELIIYKRIFQPKLRSQFPNHKCVCVCLIFYQFQFFFRLYSDHDYLVNAAGRLGLEAGQGLLEGDIVENLSSGLETARGAYNFLADLSWLNIVTSVKLVQFWTIKYLVTTRNQPQLNIYLRMPSLKKGDSKEWSYTNILYIHSQHLNFLFSLLQWKKR